MSFLEHSRDEVLAIRLKFPNKLPVSELNPTIISIQSDDSEWEYNSFEKNQVNILGSDMEVDVFIGNNRVFSSF